MTELVRGPYFETHLGGELDGNFDVGDVEYGPD